MQNLVLAVQNTAAMKDLGAATGSVTFFRSLGGTIGVSVLGAVLANRVQSIIADHLAAAGLPAGSGGGSLNLKTLPPMAQTIVREAYGDATGHIFLISAAIGAVGVIAALLLPDIVLRSGAPAPAPEPVAPAPAGPVPSHADARSHTSAPAPAYAPAYAAPSQADDRSYAPAYAATSHADARVPAFAYAPSAPWPSHADTRMQPPAPSYGDAPGAVRVPGEFGPVRGDLPTTTVRSQASAAGFGESAPALGRA
jgi:hypothetical protein